jgi:peptide/nickel transport system substrate-binding protein
MADEGDDFMSYDNPELDKANRAARTTVDEAKRMELWHQCERILHEDQPYTFLVVRKALRFFDKRIQNVHESKTGLNFVQDWVMPLPWYVPTGQQKYTR